jgi:hypothetical protein
MAWYEISLDELEHNEGEKKRRITEPRQKAVKLSEMMIERVLRQLGVDTTLPKELIHEQQRLMDIDIREMDEKQLMILCAMLKKDFNPKSLGYYIYQHNEPVAFISDPYIQHNKVKISIEPYDTRIHFDETEAGLIPS